jgi:alpha-1,6-mannosyltransferase
MAVAVANSSDRPHSRLIGSAQTNGIRIAGCAATATLALATSGILAPSYVVVAVSLIAMVVMVLMWLRLRRGLTTVTTADAYWTAAIWAIPLLAARPLFSGDVWSYMAQGLTAASGLDAYRLGPAQAIGMDSVVTQHVSHYWLDTPAPYGPVWLLLSRAVAEFTGERLIPGVLLYRLIALAGLVLIAWALPRLALRVGESPSFALWLGLLNPLVLWHLVAGVHNDAIMLGAMLVGMELALSALDCAKAGLVKVDAMRLAAGIALLTIAASIKVVAVAAICCVAAETARRHSRPIRSALLVLSGAAAGAVLLSAVGGFGWILALRTSTTVYSWMSPTTGTGLLVGALTGTHATATAVTIANTVGAVVCLPIVIRLLLDVYRGRTHPLRSLGLIFVAALLCGPVVQPWYLLWALLPLAATAQRRRERSVLSVVSAVVALVLPPLAAPTADLVAGYLIAMSVVAVAATLAVRPRRFPSTIDRHPRVPVQASVGGPTAWDADVDRSWPSQPGYGSTSNSR